MKKLPNGSEWQKPSGRYVKLLKICENIVLPDDLGWEKPPGEQKQQREGSIVHLPAWAARYQTKVVEQHL